MRITHDAYTAEKFLELKIPVAFAQRATVGYPWAPSIFPAFAPYLGAAGDSVVRGWEIWMVKELENPHETKSTQTAAANLLLPKPEDEGSGAQGNIFALGSGENQQMNAERKYDSPPIFEPVNFVIVDDAVPRDATAWSHDSEPVVIDDPPTQEAAPSLVFWAAAAIAIVVAVGLAVLTW